MSTYIIFILIVYDFIFEIFKYFIYVYSSFGDYSSLIGDDTTLVDKELLKVKKGSDDFNIALDKLVNLSKQQKKCGLEDVSEADAASLLELFQQVLSSANPALVDYEIGDIKMMLNGSWKLLYTNSEMFKVNFIVINFFHQHNYFHGCTY